MEDENDKQDIVESLKKKLHPQCFTGMSGKFAAIVGYVIGAVFTEPTIVEMVVTSDDFVVARDAGDCGCNSFIGARTSVESNWDKLMAAADLTPEERAVADAMFVRKGLRAR